LNVLEHMPTCSNRAIQHRQETIIHRILSPGMRLTPNTTEEDLPAVSLRGSRYKEGLIQKHRSITAVDSYA
jgi:hypothetical protein